MIEAYAVPDVRAAEREVMDRLPDGELMQRAAAGLAEVLRARLEPGHRLVVLAGPGDNGGDALYAGAALAGEGAPVAVVTVSEKAHAGGLAAVQAAGVEVVRWHDGGSARARAEAVVAEADLLVDGVLGIGGRPGLDADLLALLDGVPDDAYVVAVDLPSGADPEGEEPACDCVYADETVTFGMAKPVHLLPGTEAAVGRLTLVDVGVDPRAQGAQPRVQRLEAADVAARWPAPGPADDKYSRGVLGVVAGGEGYTGAPLLCVTAAVCTGVGMVRYVGPPTPTTLLRAAVPEAVHGIGRVQAWVVGPGLDPDDDSPGGSAQRQAALDALASAEPCLVDAGGLDLLDRPRSAPTLLTPHAGELARMLTRLGHDTQRADVEARPLEHGRRLADLCEATVLVKGHVVLVVEPGRSHTHETPVRSQAEAPSWLATAGAGDVLAGIGGALLAGGLAPVEAGSVAAFVHGTAAVAANPGGPVRALAVAQAVPGVVAGLLTSADLGQWRR